MADEVSKGLWQKSIIARKFDVMVVGTKNVHVETEDPLAVIYTSSHSLSLVNYHFCASGLS